MTNTMLYRWTRALGAAVLVVAVLPLSAGPAAAHHSAAHVEKKAAAGCPGNSQNCDSPAAPGDANPASGTPAAGTPAAGTPASGSSSVTPVGGAPADKPVAQGTPAAAAEAQGKPATKPKDEAPSAPAVQSNSSAASTASDSPPASSAKAKDKPAAKEKNSNGASVNEPKKAPAANTAPAVQAPKAQKAQKDAKGDSAAATPAGSSTPARDGDKKPGAPKQGGHTPVNVCHATSSDSNPYVFITVDDDSVKAEGHLAHRNEPNKTWKSAGTFRGDAHAAGDPKPDLIDGLDGVIDEASDCDDLTPPPPPPPTLVKATGSFLTVCTPATGVTATIGPLTTGSATPGSFRLVATGFSVSVVSNQTNVAVPADTVLRLEYVPTSGNVQVVQTMKSEKACPAVTPPTTGELSKSSVPPSGSVVTAGQTIDYTVAVRNTGQVAITNAPVVDTLPAFVTVVSGTVSNSGVVSGDGRTITWTANLAPGASETYTYQGLVAANAPTGTSLVNKVTFQLQERTTTHIVGARSLAVTKAVSAAVVRFGEPLTYTLTVRALGTQGQSAVVVRDGIPAGTTYVPGSAACDTAGPCMESFRSNEVTWQLGSMAPGTTRTVTFRVTVDTPRATVETGIPAVTIRNVGLAFSAEVPPTPSNEVVTDVVAVGGVKTGPNGPGGPGGGSDDGSGGGPTSDDDVAVAPTSGGPLAHTGAGLPFGAVLLFGGLLLLAGIALLRLGWSTRGTAGAPG